MQNTNNYNDGADAVSQRRPKASKARPFVLNLLRVSLLTVAVLSAVAFAYYTYIFMYGKKPAQSAQIIQNENVVLNNPHFVTYSKSGGMVTITAKTAKKPLDKNAKYINLESPSLSTEAGTLVTAQNGTWNQQTHELKLSGQVKYNNKDGDVANAQSAYWGKGDPLAQGASIQLEGNDVLPQGDKPFLYMIGQFHYKKVDGDTLNSQYAKWDDEKKLLDAGGNATLVNKVNDVLSAKTMHYDANAKTLDALGNVVVKTKDEVVNSDSLNVDLNTNIAIGKGNIAAKSSMGVFSGQTYEYHRNDSKIILQGNAKALIKK